MIITNNISKTFFVGQPNELKALKNVSLSIEQGAVVLLKGASGSGKSTLLSILSCLSKPTEGEYLCMGKAVSRWSEKFLTQFRQQYIGIIFQHFNLLKGLTVQDNIALPLIPLLKSRKQIMLKVQEAAQKAHIEHRLSYVVDTLSGGELQRVAIARSLVNNPSIVVADEPTAHLDSDNAAKMMRIFDELKNNGCTIIISSHDPLVLTHHIFDAVIAMKDGEIMQ